MADTGNVCELCGGSVAWNNTTGICRTNPKCRAENSRKISARIQGVEFVPHPESRMCEICKGPLQWNNKIGICRTNRECKNQWTHKDWCIKNGTEYHPLISEQFCIRCGNKLRRGNETNICMTNPDCKPEYLIAREKLRYEKDKPGQRNRRIRHYESCNHDEVTYVMYSPRLNTHKIGITTNMASRLTNLRNGCWDIALVTTFPHGRKLERWLHRHFKQNRIKGTEWFSDLVIEDIQEAILLFEQEVF